jgi:hypothetical protein
VRQLFILLLSICSVYATGQVDTLSADKIDFQFLGQTGDDLENVGLVVRLIAHYEADKPTFYKLRLNHQHGSNYRSSTTYDLNSSKNKTGHDTLILHVRQPLPGDKFVLEYFQNPKFKKEFNILSTESSNRKPYYIDIVFVYNGDTVNTSSYNISSLYLAQKSISKINDRTLRVSNLKLTEFTIQFKNKNLYYEIPRTEVLYHKFITAGYVDNVKSIEKNAERIDVYSSSIKYMKEQQAKKMRFITVFDIFDKGQVTSHFSQEW